MRANAELKGGETAKPLLLISRTLAQLQIIPLTRLLRSTINVSSAWNYVCIGLQRGTTSEARYVTAAHMIPLKSNFKLLKYTKCSVKMSVNRSIASVAFNNRFFHKTYRIDLLIKKCFEKW